MPASQPANFNLQEFSDAGLLLFGGRLYTYAYGTTAQKIAYTDPAGAVPHTYTADGAGGQYIALNARGELPAPLYLATGSYDLALKRGDGSTIWTRKADGVDNTPNSLAAALAAPTGTTLVGFGANRTLRQQLDMLYYGIANVLDPLFAGGADPTGVADSTAAFQAAFNAKIFVHVPDTSAYFKITNTVTFKAEHIVLGRGMGSTRIVMTDPTKWAFACDPVASSYFNNAETVGGGFFDIDLRARYGIRLGSPNLANAPTYNYADAASFFAACKVAQQFRVERCNLFSDIDYAAAYNYIAASPNWNTLTVPTNQDLYTRGCGIFFANNYRGAVRDCQIKFYGIGVWLFGSDLGIVRDCRIGNNLRHVNVQFQWSSGAQCEIVHNDFLANYRYGGVYTSAAHTTIGPDNYFENTGGATNSTINSYIVDTAQTTNTLSNRFDDYGSTKTSGPLITFGGVGGAVCSLNRVADNRPGGAGTLATLEVLTTGWPPTNLLFNQHGLVLMGENDSSFPRVRHPLISYDLDGCNPLEWSPTRKHRDIGYVDISGGGIMPYKFAQDGNGLWYLNEAPFQNGIILKPGEYQLTKGLNYIVAVRGKCIMGAGPFNVFAIIKWTTSAGVTTNLFAANLVFTNNTTVQELTQAVAIPAVSGGYFTVYLDPTGANLYGIKISEA